MVHNVTELRRKDRALLSKDATIREIHHRVKNNLQTVSALLRLQARRTEDSSASAAIEEAVRRVASIAVVHETLSASIRDSVIFDEVIEKIMKSALELSPRSQEISVVKKGEFGQVTSLMATPLALALTELIHNALEHGLADVGDRVEVSVRGEGDDVVVEVRDNGRGLRENFDIESDMNLGLQIVKTLTENELSGALTFINGEPGTIAKIRFRRDSGFPSFSRDGEQRDVS